MTSFMVIGERNRDKNWESTHSEVLISSPMDDMVNNVLDGSFSPVHGTKSVCLDITDHQKRHSLFRRVSGKAKDDQFLQTQDTLSLSSEISEKKVPILRKLNSVAEGNSSSPRNQAKLVWIEIPEQKMSSSLKKCNTVPFMKKLDESRSPSSDDVPAKKELDKKVPPLRKSNSTRTKKINMILQDRLCENMQELTFKPIKSIEEKQKFLREQDELYSRCRKEAFEMMSIARRFTEDRRDAYARADHNSAKQLTEKIKIAREAAFKLNRKAAQEILETTNKKNGIMKIDLHGLHPSEAIHAVKKRLNAIETKSKTLCFLSSMEKPLSLEVITGVGKHSRGVPKLPPAVRTFLVDEGYQFKEGRPGVIMVRPKFRAT